jgi:hypothetical protein
MLNKNLLFKVSSLLVIGVMLVGTPALALAKGPKNSENVVTGNYAVMGTGNTGALAMPAPGMASVDVINYLGAGGELTVDFAGITYRVPASLNGGNQQWNHVQFNLPPGTYNYTASATGNDTVINNTITLEAGKVTSLGFYANLPEILTERNNDEAPKNDVAGQSATTRSLKDLDDLLVGIGDETAQAH